MLKWIITFTLTAFLTSCGFHLRGTTPLAPQLQQVYLKTPNPYSDFSNNLRQYLKMSGVYLTKTQQMATVVLSILSENSVQQLLGVNGSQQTRQYQLTYSITFQLTTPNDVTITQPEIISESRTLPINSGAVLAGSNQAAALYQQMRRAVVFDVINRLSSQEITYKLQATRL